MSDPTTNSQQADSIQPTSQSTGSPAQVTARKEIAELLSNYQQLLADDRLNKYNEAQTKSDFIEPLFKILGWDVINKAHPIIHEVTREEKISRGRVDYGFRINGIIKFYLEAKSFKEGVDDNEYAKQAITYAWNRDCTWAILTDFKKLKIFNAQWHTSDLSQNHLKTIECTDYLNRFDELWLLSRENFEKELLDKQAEKWGKKITGSAVGTQLLEDFTYFREILSKSVTRLNRNKLLTQESLDDAVQRILDRLIFIRNCEDRQLEESQLIPIVREHEADKRHSIVEGLRKVFSSYDSYYNSKIFSDDLCDHLEIDDKVLTEIIQGMKYPRHRLVAYDFSVIESDVLGNIYEQYLGYILRKTAKRASLVESQSHRKQHGIYYTPTRIVDYIVQNTLRELMRNGKKREDIHILDPACGSGSFLIKAFDFLNDYEKKHRKDYDQTRLDTSDQSLTYTSKVKILRDSIFGVDLDKQAVEISQLNLLLKIAEGGKRLPLLQNNIRQGNSLIDDSLNPDDRAFNWSDKFPEIMDKHGGFNAIIGNPPYVFGGNEGITIGNKEYFKARYTSAKRKLNLFSLFIERSLSLLHENGLLGFIVPNTLLRVTSYEDTRRYILSHSKILQIVNLEAGVFQGVTASTIIIILQKESRKEERSKHKVKIYHNGISSEFITKPQRDFAKNNMYIFDLTSNKKGPDNFFAKLHSGSVDLGSICKEMIFGVVITKNFDEVVSGTKRGSKYKKFLEGRDIDRYRIKFGGKYLLYERSKLHRPRTPEVFEVDEKILVQRISGGKRPLKAAYDDERYYDKESINNIIISDKRFNIKYILGLLNSSLFNWYYAKKFSNESTLTVNVSKAYLSQLPIKDIPRRTQEPLVKLVDKMLLLNERLNKIDEDSINEIESVQEEIGTTDKAIDQIVYSIYGLVDKEKQAIERFLS